MSRHRNIKNMNYDDEMDDDDYDDYGSYEEEPPMSPGASEFMYRRNRSTASNTYAAPKVQERYEDLPNDAVHDYDHGAVFQMDDLDDAPPAKIAPGPPPGFEPLPSRHVVVSLPITGTSTMKFTEKPTLPQLTNLRVSETPRSSSKSPSRKNKDKETPSSVEPTLASNLSSTRLSQLAAITSVPSTPRRVKKRHASEKELINLVVVGHVDAGKSTMMGHLLYQLGCVDQRTIHKYKQESARDGKSSFAFAWVLDETAEERARGVTMDIAKTSFETDTKRVLLLDAPGHKDFIPNMITGASQADAAILVINATRGEFETGFENGGQTREHAMLLRSLGVNQLVVAVNKLDTIEWSEARFREVESIMTAFLCKNAGFSKIKFVPLSGLNGENLTRGVPDSHPLRKWYTGHPLIRYIDEFKAPPRASEGPLRIVINDVFKATTAELSVSGKIESGEVENGDKVYIMPNADAALVKGCTNDDGGSSEHCLAGDQVLLTLQGKFEPDSIHAGYVVTRGGGNALIPGRRFLARLVVFDIIVPLMKGTKAELYCHSICEPCTLVKLISSINKANGDVLKQKPRCLSRNMSGIVEIETDFDVAIEPYTVCKALGRITLRAGGQTIAAGIIEKKIS